eukprot:365743-Chlamydomonas_euryale.AAC.34
MYATTLSRWRSTPKGRDECSHNKEERRLHQLACGASAHLSSEDTQLDVFAGARGVVTFRHGQLAGNQRKQVARLAPRILPHSVATFLEVAVAQQHRIQRLVCLNACCVDRHDIGPVEEVRDATETLSLALHAHVARVGHDTRAVAGRCNETWACKHLGHQTRACMYTDQACLARHACTSLQAALHARATFAQPACTCCCYCRSWLPPESSSCLQTCIGPQGASFPAA